MTLRELNNRDEKNIAEWHDEVLLLRYHVRLSMSATNQAINWNSLAFGFFLGKGYKISEAREMVQQLRARRILEPMDGT